MNQDTVNGIVLLHKKPGRTSFQSIGAVKKVLGTKKVGHTGTLDSFAEGLLVVCAGALTRLSSRITSFDKEYVARIVFGSQTDTLDPTGSVIKTAPLPALDDLKAALKKHTGNIMQRPPEFSAVKSGGVRASDLVRSGAAVEIPERPVTVYESALLDAESDGSGLVKEARVCFRVSKGTYIRSLARDIALDCKSAAHLKELFRSRVGNFKIEDAVCIEDADAFKADPASVKKILHPMDESLALECGFSSLVLLPENEGGFFNGRPIKASWFKNSGILKEKNPAASGADSQAFAVFASGGVFCGLVRFLGAQLKYDFVVPQKR